MKIKAAYLMYAFLMLSLVLSGCQPAVSTEAAVEEVVEVLVETLEEAWDIADMVPQMPEVGGAQIQLDTYLSGSDFSGSEIPVESIVSGYLRSWDLPDHGVIYLTLLQFNSSESAGFVYEGFSSELRDQTTSMKFGIDSIITYSEFDLVVGGVWYGEFLIIAGTAIVDESGISPPTEAAIDLIYRCADNLESALDLGLGTKPNNQEIAIMASVRPERTPISIIKKPLTSEIPFALADTMTSKDVKITLGTAAGNNGYVIIRLVTTNQGVTKTGPPKICKYRVDAYITEIFLKDDGDDFFRGNGDVTLYADLKTICDRVEYKTGDIAPTDGVESGVPLNFTANGKTDGRKITSLECESKCVSNCNYSVHIIAMDADSNDALDIAGYLLNIGAKISNNTKVLGDVQNLRKTLLHKEKEISSSEQSQLQTLFRNLRGDYLGEGNWPLSTGGSQPVEIPAPPADESKP
jgi:hypothetical protein